MISLDGLIRTETLAQTEGRVLRRVCDAEAPALIEWEIAEAQIQLGVPLMGANSEPGLGNWAFLLVIHTRERQIRLRCRANGVKMASIGFWERICALAKLSLVLQVLP